MRKTRTDGDSKHGSVNANAERHVRLLNPESYMAAQNHVAAYGSRWHIKEQPERGLLIKNNANNGEWQMLNSCIVTLVIVLLGVFVAGSCELAEERAERKRVEKWLKEKYPRTY